MTKDEATARSAMELALEALEDTLAGNLTRYQAAKTITALREALASEAIEQPAPATELREQEPVFWTRKQWGMDREFCEKPFTTDWEPLYKSPPAQRTWVELTDEERFAIADEYQSSAAAALMVEAKLKEKNT